MKTRISAKTRLRALGLLGVILIVVGIIVVVGLILKLLIGVIKKKLYPPPSPGQTNSVAMMPMDYQPYTVDGTNAFVITTNSEVTTVTLPDPGPVSLAGPDIEILSQRQVDGGTELTFSISLPADLVFSDQFSNSTAIVTIEGGSTFGQTTNWQSVAETVFNINAMEMDTWYWFETDLTTTNSASSGFYRAAARPGP